MNELFCERSISSIVRMPVGKLQHSEAIFNVDIVVCKNNLSLYSHYKNTEDSIKVNTLKT